MNHFQNSHSAKTAKERLQQNRHIPENVTIETLKKQIPTADIKTCLQIIQMLDKLGTDAALDALVMLLPHDTPQVRQALSKIWLRQHPRYRQHLHHIVMKADLPARIAALEIIATDLSPHHVTVLALCLNDEQPSEIQNMAERILQAIQTPESTRIAISWRQQQFDTDAEAHHAQYERQVRTENTMLAVIASDHKQLVNYRQSFLSLLSHIRTGQWGDQQDAARAIHSLVRSICDDPSADYRAIRQDFLNLLHDPDKMMRWVAIEALARLGDPETVPALVSCLGDPSWTVRIAVIRALIEIGDVAAVNSLSKLVADPNASVQEAAVEAIGLLGSLKDVPLLASIVDSDYEDMVRLAAIEAVYRLRGVQGVPALLKMLDDPHTTLRWHAAMALSDLADESSVPVLIKHLGDETHPRWEEKRVCDWLSDALLRINTPVARVAVKRWQQESL